jgi:hypothetical protein
MMALMTIACNVLLHMAFYCKLPLYTNTQWYQNSCTRWATKAAHRLLLGSKV